MTDQVVAVIEFVVPATDEEARVLVRALYGQWLRAQAEAAESKRRVSGLRMMLDGLVEMYPATAELLETRGEITHGS